MRLAQGFQGPRQEERRNGRNRAKPKRTSQGGPGLPCGRDEIRRAGQNCARPFNRRLPRLGQGCTARFPLDQLHAQQAFNFLDGS